MAAVAVYAVVIIASYLYGAIPWGLIIGRASRGIDVRQHGSGNIGFANVQRSIGLPLALLVLAGDISKGVLPVLVSRLLWDDPNLQVAGAIAAVAGHTWPVYLRFRGGKGVATAAGAVITVAPGPASAVAAIALLFMFISRYVSLTVLIFAPILSALMLALALFGLTQYAYFVYVAAATAIIFYRHRENIQRLRAGTEAKLGQPLRKKAL